ncbi:hypothetical protein DOFOFD_07945 [Acetobacteraceae bacterium EV16P]|uniref:CinA C-terminal domain-containing protein n=1 Tax=Sorlinia euscelidii TaxID=3081148 RepID=A0ABU7U4P0_9PROT
MVSDRELLKLAGTTIEALRKRGLRVVTVESCTGGMVVSLLTAHAGASDVVEGGWSHTPTRLSKILSRWIDDRWTGTAPSVRRSSSRWRLARWIVPSKRTSPLQSAALQARKVERRRSRWARCASALRMMAAPARSVRHVILREIAHPSVRRPPNMRLSY